MVWAKRSAARLSKGLVLKGSCDVLPCEAGGLRIVASKLGILAPCVLRSFQFADDTKYFGTMRYTAMDYINCQSLDSCWEGLGDEQKLGRFTANRPMILETQSVKHRSQGQLVVDHVVDDSSLITGPVHSRTRPSLKAGSITSWRPVRNSIRLCKISPPSSSQSSSLPISPRNLILDQDGLVWLVDWADAGTYPPAFESAALASQMSFPDFSAMELSFLPRYPDEERQLHSSGYGLTTAALSE
jgi:hypothetical protein